MVVPLLWLSLEHLPPDEVLFFRLRVAPEVSLPPGGGILASVASEGFDLLKVFLEHPSP